MKLNLPQLQSTLSDLTNKGIFIGTSSWKYPGWCGQLYDENKYMYRGKFAETRFKRDCLANHVLQLKDFISIANVPGMDRFECCARAVFPFDLSAKSQLRTFLEGLLGAKYFTEKAGISINLEKTLRDMDCEIEVVHGPHNEEKYDWPMVLVVNAKPAPHQAAKTDKEERTK